jgi:hypothetical protein
VPLITGSVSNDTKPLVVDDQLTLARLADITAAVRSICPETVAATVSVDTALIAAGACNYRQNIVGNIAAGCA